MVCSRLATLSLLFIILDGNNTVCRSLVIYPNGTWTIHDPKIEVMYPRWANDSPCLKGEKETLGSF